MKHQSIVVHWLTRWRCVPGSTNSRTLFFEPFQITEALFKLNAWPVVRQWRAKWISRPVAWQDFGIPSCASQTNDQFGPRRRWKTESKGRYKRNSTVSTMVACPLRVLVVSGETPLAVRQWGVSRDVFHFRYSLNVRQGAPHWQGVSLLIYFFLLLMTCDAHLCYLVMLLYSWLSITVPTFPQYTQFSHNVTRRLTRILEQIFWQSKSFFPM